MHIFLTRSTVVVFPLVPVTPKYFGFLGSGYIMLRMLSRKEQNSASLKEKISLDNTSIFLSIIQIAYCAQLNLSFSFFTSSGVVEFSENKLDILIDGTPRKNHGKGVRALLRSAFNVGLMRFCAEYDRPHPRLVVLDSPLLNFKERSARDMREEISGEIKQAFFADLASTSDDEQIIVLENEPVPMYLEQKINLIEFVGPFREGRSGFFPS